MLEGGLPPIINSHLRLAVMGFQRSMPGKRRVSLQLYSAAWVQVWNRCGLVSQGETAVR